MYQGADQTKNGFSPWWAWDIRGWLNRLVWEILRFQVPAAPPADRTVPLGLRDSVNAILYLAEQNNHLLQAIAAKVGATVSVAEVSTGVALSELRNADDESHIVRSENCGRDDCPLHWHCQLEVVWTFR